MQVADADRVSDGLAAQAAARITAPTGDLRRATFGRRWAGYLIDQVLTALLSVAILLLFTVALLPDANTQEDLDALQAAATLLGIIVAFAYRWLMDSCGGTLGKLFVGLRVVNDTTMKPPGLASGFVRTFVSLGSGAALGLGYLWSAWDTKGKTWHDHAARTIVVRS